MKSAQSMLAVVLALGIASAASAGSWEDSFRNARVSREFDASGLPIASVTVATNTIVAGLQDGDSSRIIVVWDTTGKELFRVSRRDTSLPVDNGHRLGLYLSDVSDDGSTFALFQAWNTTLYDRAGDSLASFWSQPQGRLSPNGLFWMPMSSFEDYQCDFQLRSRTGALLEEFVSDSESYGSGEFLSNGQILAYWTRRGISMDLPSREIQTRIDRPDDFSDSWTFSVIRSNTGQFAAIRGAEDAVLIVDSLGTQIREIRAHNAWPIAFSPDDSILGVITQGTGARYRLVLASVTDTADVWTAPLEHDILYWTDMHFLPSPNRNTARVFLSQRYGLTTNALEVNLSDGTITDSFEMRADFQAIPGDSNRFIRLFGESEERVLGNGFVSRHTRYYSKIELVELAPER